MVTATGSAIPVVRGWATAPSGAGRADGPGRRWSASSSPRRTAAPTDTARTDDVLPELSMTDLLPRAPYDLYGGYVVATDRACPPGAVDGAPVTGMTGLDAGGPQHLPGADASSGLRNLLYAFQWWVFGAFAIFMWWRWLQEDVLGRRRSPGRR